MYICICMHMYVYACICNYAYCSAYTCTVAWWLVPRYQAVPGMRYLAALASNLVAYDRVS